jgi:hypothetical protein
MTAGRPAMRDGRVAVTVPENGCVLGRCPTSTLPLSVIGSSSVSMSSPRSSKTTAANSSPSGATTPLVGPRPGLTSATRSDDAGVHAGGLHTLCVSTAAPGEQPATAIASATSFTARTSAPSDSRR